MPKPDFSRRVAQSPALRSINPRANLALARQHEKDVAPSNRTRWLAYRSVLRAAGINPKTLKADRQPYNAATVRRRWLEPYSPDWGEFAAEVPGFPPLAQAEWKPVFALGIALRRLFGLDHRLSGSKRYGTQYAVDERLLARQQRRLSKRERNPHAKK